jgi:hypothetical protein
VLNCAGVRRDEAGGVSIRRWHWGKIAILWAWGGTLVALLVASFLSQTASETPIKSSVTFLAILFILILLSVLTWAWLGGKEKET